MNTITVLVWGPKPDDVVEKLTAAGVLNPRIVDPEQGATWAFKVGFNPSQVKMWDERCDMGVMVGWLTGIVGCAIDVVLNYTFE